LLWTQHSDLSSESSNSVPKPSSLLALELFPGGVDAVSDDDWEVRASAARALGAAAERGSASAIAGLATTLVNDPYEAVRYECLEAIGAIAAPMQ
jgi:HEAT repeat protein